MIDSFGMSNSVIDRCELSWGQLARGYIQLDRAGYSGTGSDKVYHLTLEALAPKCVPNAKEKRKNMNALHSNLDL